MVEPALSPTETGAPTNERFHLIQAAPLAGSIGAEARELITSSEDIFVTDQSGRKLIDGPAGMWCINVGHRNKALADTLRDQAMSLTYSTPWYTSNAPAE
ncbi:MAG: aminotransferase class III-fold pyridoxal phosphate-dependent enzyme, partial [Mesorhizobium sp.]